MCGIVGARRAHTSPPLETAVLIRMLSLLHHRGPDEQGVYQDSRLSMGSARLSVIDITSGQQPISNEDGSLWIVSDGEIYNSIELAADLRRRGHIFRTHCDTEVLVHLYEEYGVDCLTQLNGQFAFAIWDVRKSELFLARDRVGIRPLYYTSTRNALVFGSEIKALLAYPEVSVQLDPIALDQIFTFWTTLTPKTIFEGIHELPPGHYLLADDRRQEVRPYWTLIFPAAEEIEERELDDVLCEFEALLADSVRRRLRADVPVAAYLSGGIDSCTTVDFALRCIRDNLRTFSIRFRDAEFDETSYQRLAVQFFETEHADLTCDQAALMREFANVIWHTETPILRTAPVPFYLLSRLVRDNGFKVVMTGDGADEVLGGYNIFKETLIRHFWARQPESTLRPLLLKRLYAYLPHIAQTRNGLLKMFFGVGLTNTDDPVYSHLPRWKNTSRAKQFFAQALFDQIGQYDALEDVRLGLFAGFDALAPLAKAQCLETNIFMSGYLLSSQGDRVSMAHSVQGRFPFLDHRIIEFGASLPAHFKLRGLTEKYLLKRMMQDRLPANLTRRVKQPYRAPALGIELFTDAGAPLREMLSEGKIKAVGVFDAKAVNHLVDKTKRGIQLTETEGMALAGILSTQLVHEMFVNKFDQYAQVPLQPVMRACTASAR